MTVKLSKAKQLCTKSEYEIVLSSSSKKVQQLTPARLRQKISLARKLRDKYRKLAESQRREARGKQKPRGATAAAGNENTRIKAQVFAESLDRFETALKKAAGKSTTAKKTKKKTTTKKKGSANKSSAKKSTMKKKKTSTKKATAPAASGTKRTKKKSSKKNMSNAPKKSAASVKSKSSSGKQLVIAPAVGASRKPATISAKPITGSPFGMRGTGAKANQESRATRRKKSSKHARFGTVESQFARTSQEKIHGHVSGQTRRNQAKRDG